MEYEEITQTDKNNQKQFDQMIDIFKAAKDDEDFVKMWLKAGNTSIRFLPGLDDNKAHNATCIVPMFNDTELAYIYVSLGKMRAYNPDTKPITSFIKTTNVLEKRSIKINEEAIDKIQDDLKIDYNVDLVNDYGSYNAVYNFARMFIISDGTDVKFTKADREEIFDVEELKDESLLDKEIYLVELEFKDIGKNGGEGFGQFMYFSF